MKRALARSRDMLGLPPCPFSQSQDHPALMHALCPFPFQSGFPSYSGLILFSLHSFCLPHALPNAGSTFLRFCGGEQGPRRQLRDTLSLVVITESDW